MSRRVRGRPTNGPAPGPGNRWIIPTVALFVVLPVGAAIAQAVGGGDDSAAAKTDRLRDDRAGSVSLGLSPTPLLPDEMPTTYSVVYRVTETATDRPQYTNEELQVRRPFDSRLTVRSGTTPGEGAIRSQRVSSLTKLATRDSAGNWTLFRIPPALASADVRFGAALDQALADKDVVVRERRRVAGRECQVFRAGNSIQAGVIEPYESGSPSYADFCVDREGLVLEEVWYLDGKRVQRRVAAEVQTDVDLRDQRFTVPDTARVVTAAQGGGSARPLALDSRPPGAFWELPAAAVPEGFELTGRWAVIAPRTDVMRDPTKPNEPSSWASTVDVYVRDADVLVVERGALTGTGTLPQAANPRPVDLGGVGQGIAITDFRMNEVRAQKNADFVRVYGTVPIGMLVEAARALTVVPGGELKYLDE